MTGLRPRSPQTHSTTVLHSHQGSHVPTRERLKLESPETWTWWQVSLMPALLLQIARWRQKNLPELTGTEPCTHCTERETVPNKTEDKSQHKVFLTSMAHRVRQNSHKYTQRQNYTETETERDRDREIVKRSYHKSSAPSNRLSI